MRIFKVAFVVILVMPLILNLSCKKGENGDGSLEEGEEGMVVKEGEYLYITATKLNLRSKPSLEGKVITVLDKGDRVTFLEKSSETEYIDEVEDYWYRVRTSEGDEGWLFGKYISESEPYKVKKGGTGGGLPDFDTTDVPDGLSALECYKEGKKLYNEARYDEAIAYLTKACQLDDEFGKAYFQLGLAYQELGDSDGAVEVYEKAVVLMPDSFWAHNNLGLACINTGNYERAVEVLETALTLDPEGRDTTAGKEEAYNIARKNLKAARTALGM